MIRLVPCDCMSHTETLREYFGAILKRGRCFPSYGYSYFILALFCHEYPNNIPGSYILNTWISRKLVSMGTLSTRQFSNAFLLSRWHFSNSKGINIASGHEIYDIKWFVCGQNLSKQHIEWTAFSAVCLLVGNYSQIPHFGTDLNTICSASKF